MSKTWMLVVIVCTCLMTPVLSRDDKVHIRNPIFKGMRSWLSRQRRDTKHKAWTTRSARTWVPVTGTPYWNMTELEIANKHKNSTHADLDSNGFPKPHVGSRNSAKPITDHIIIHVTMAVTATLDSMHGKEPTGIPPRPVITGAAQKNRDGRSLGDTSALGRHYVIIIAVLAGALVLCVVAMVMYTLRRRTKRKVMVITA
ncbi:uncharacterized protein LOC116604268 [Nematostella vectensis]|uniref:uncharacterized protein LOC116604268 n=1 Tax=Nematostella vectensis TaxID=45351 RepID=UPI001390108A|nr:uncharacterized protein LOC116604268 [Nematostella vectensis]